MKWSTCQSCGWTRPRAGVKQCPVCGSLVVTEDERVQQVPQDLSEFSGHPEVAENQPQQPPALPGQIIRFRLESIIVVHKPHGAPIIFLKVDEDTCRAVFGQYHKFNHQLDLALQVPEDRVDDAIRALGLENLPRSDVGR